MALSEQDGTLVPTRPPLTRAAANRKFTFYLTLCEELVRWGTGDTIKPHMSARHADELSSYWRTCDIICAQEDDFEALRNIRTLLDDIIRFYERRQLRFSADPSPVGDNLLWPLKTHRWNLMIKRARTWRSTAEDHDWSEDMKIQPEKPEQEVDWTPADIWALCTAADRDAEEANPYTIATGMNDGMSGWRNLNAGMVYMTDNHDDHVLFNDTRNVSRLTDYFLFWDESMEDQIDTSITILQIDADATNNAKKVFCFKYMDHGPKQLWSDALYLKEEYGPDYDGNFAVNFRGLTTRDGFFQMKREFGKRPTRQLVEFQRWLSKQETYGFITKLRHNRHRDDDVDCDAAYATNS